MLTEEEIRCVIRERLEATEGSSNSWLVYHTDGVMRGLLWALLGKDPGCYLTANVPRLLDMAGIFYADNQDGTLGFPEPQKEESF